MKVIDYHEAVFASELTYKAKLTALAISSYYNWTKQQMCWPSNATLAKATGLSIRTVSRSHKELAETGYIEVWHRSNNSNMYRPTVPSPGHTVSSSGHTVSSSGHTVLSVLTHSLINNEVNNELNNEINNEKDKGSNEPLDIIIISESKKEELLSW
jgi:DNA-binding transcriptional MocR family regulator